MSDSTIDFNDIARGARRACGRIICAVALLATTALAASAVDQMYFPAVDNVTNQIVARINAETVRIDISAWYLTEHSISVAIANRFAAGVPVRLIGDRGSIFEIDVHTKNEFYWLANQGVPIRLRYNPNWFPEIDHWKVGIFVGQGIAEFGSANWTPFELAPWSSTNYDDETALFTDDPALFNALETKFDRMWNDTTAEPNSIISSPPYLKNWSDACAAEGTACDFAAQYPNPAPMTINTARLWSDYPLPADVIWGQGSEFNNRLVQEINNENTEIDFVIYRLTVDNITQALLTKRTAGVPMKLLVEPGEYLNRKWPEFWLTHANIDRLWVAGIPIRQRVHDGLTHMKTLVTSTYATNASSNYAANWQRDVDYFIPASTKPTIYNAVKNRVLAMWNDTAGFGPFVPQPADAATLATPSSGATGVSTSPTLTWNAAAFATSYDVYLGTSQSSLSKIGNTPAQLVQNPPSTYSFTPPAALAAGTTYFWKVISRTFATDKDATIVNSSLVWSFTTSGSSNPPPGGSLPTPWVDQDVGAVGVSGTAAYASGTFSVSGAGSDIWGTSDSFNFASQSVGGDGQIVARVVSEQNTNTYAKAGVMYRDGTGASAASVILDVRPDGSVEFMARSSAGGATNYVAGATQPFPAWMKLTRSGTTFTAYVSADGSRWTALGSTSASIASTAAVGLAVTSHNTSTLNTASFDSVSVTGGSTPPPTGSLPSPWASRDIGSTGAAGTSTYSSGTFSVSGAGADIWGTSDAFQYAYQPLGGDGQIVARVTAEQNTNTYAKAGVMLRAGLTASDAHVILDVRPDGTVEFMARPTVGSDTNYIAGATQPFPAWLKLVRSGATVTGFISANGSAWNQVGTTTLATSAYAGLAVTSHVTSTLNAATFDTVAVTPATSGGGTTATDVVVYAGDVTSLHGSWSKTSDSTAAGGVKLVTPDAGLTQANNPLASPSDYVDVTFAAAANTPYTIWLRLQALGNSKYNDSAWVQFSDALVNGSPAYAIGSTTGLLVNLATDSTGGSLNAWGWQNGAYWLSQGTTVTFPASGTHTLRIQMREDGVQFDQIVLSPATYLNAAPGPVSNDHTIVPKP